MMTASKFGSSPAMYTCPWPSRSRCTDNAVSGLSPSASASCFFSLTSNTLRVVGMVNAIKVHSSLIGQYITGETRNTHPDSRFVVRLAQLPIASSIMERSGTVHNAIVNCFGANWNEHSARIHHDLSLCIFKGYGPIHQSKTELLVDFVDILAQVHVQACNVAVLLSEN